MSILNRRCLTLAQMDASTALERPGDIAAGIQDSRLRRLYEYWLIKKRDRRLPARSDIDPLDFTYVLGHVMLLDVLRNPLRFRVRVHGTEMVMRAGYDLTGKLMDDLPDPDYRRYVRERCEGLVRTGEPLALRHDRTLDRRIQRYEALWLPFSDDGQNVTTLLCAMIYDRHLD